MSIVLNLVGKKYGWLTVIEFLSSDGRKKYWLCKCECGNDKILPSDRLQSGNTKSCGCKKNRGSNKTHGHTCNGIVSSEFSIWYGIIDRCTNPNNQAYKDYGGRGIMVCERWLNSLENFLEDMGLRPSKKYSIDRINNNGDYEKSNCRWATRKEQTRNTRKNVLITHNGATHCISEWAEITGIKMATLYRRIVIKKWSLEKSFNPKLFQLTDEQKKLISIRIENSIPVDVFDLNNNPIGRYKSARDCAKKMGLSEGSIYMVTGGKWAQYKGYIFKKAS